MIQNINIHKLNVETYINPLLPLKSYISLYDIKIVLWEEIDSKICDIIKRSGREKLDDTNK